MATWKKVLVIITISVVSLYALFMIGYFVTSEPVFCSTCHDVDQYVKSWRQSPHNSVKCLYCHEFRGFLGKLHSKARGLNYVYQQITGQYTVFAKALIFEPNCVGCHLGDYYNYPNAIRMDKKHYKYLQEDRSCLECHRDTGHKTDIFQDIKFTNSK